MATIFIAENIETATPVATSTPANPGPGSAIASPLLFSLEQLDPNAIARVDLRSQTGALIARQLLSGSADALLYFDVEGDTDALLVLSVEDAYGRLMRVSSTEVTLLATGNSDLAPEDAAAAIEFSAPQDVMQIDGDSVRVYVFVDSEDGRAYNIRMITREGRVVANRDVYSEDGVVQAEVLANVNDPTFVRVIVSRSVNGVIIELNSVEVELIPD